MYKVILVVVCAYAPQVSLSEDKQENLEQDDITDEGILDFVYWNWRN